MDIKLIINIGVVLFCSYLVATNYEYKTILLLVIILSSFYLGRRYFGLNKERQKREAHSPPSLPSNLPEEFRLEQQRMPI